MKSCVVTIVSCNYLAYARTLERSLVDVDARVDFHVLMVDRRTASVTSAVEASGLVVTYAEDLGLPDAERLFYKYDIVELNTALKPTFLKRMFDAGYERVTYLDPDIMVHAPLHAVDEALLHHTIVLTPHATRPVMDGFRPSDVDFLRAGAYNLGFIALRASASARAMLDWWESRCLGLGFNDPAFGTFVDQKWIDLVPSLFDGVHVLRDPTHNVAYWNLHERQLEATPDGWAVNGRRLVFFHFSGIVPDSPAILSKHQTRHRAEPGSPLHALLETYCAHLKRNGHGRFSSIPYGFSMLDDGTPITPVMRRALLAWQHAETDPFKSASRLQRALRQAGLHPRRSQASPRRSTTITFNADDRRLRATNALIRLAARVIGLDRLLLLIQYAGLLNRESHLPAVLLRQPLQLEHRERR